MSRPFCSFVIAALCALAFGLLLTACDNHPPTPRDTASKQHVPKDRPAPQRPSGGIGMGFNGKLGIELAPGLVMGFDGSIGPGFGF